MTVPNQPAWKGYWPAAPTPYTRDGALDLDALASELDMYVRHGVHGILVNGTTGEWYSQRPQERRDVARAAVEAVGGRVPVVVGITDYRPDDVIALGQHAVDVGADGVLATPPPYVHPEDDEIVAFYRTVCAGIDGPMMVYNWPRGAAVDMSVQVLSRIADIDGVAAIKESAPDETKVLQVLEAVGDRVLFFGRFIHRRGLAAIRELGGDGNIDGGGVGAPFAVSFYEALWRGDLDAARAASAAYEGLIAGLVTSDYGARYASPTAQVKAVMRVLGQPGGWVRPPLLTLEDEQALAEIARHLEDCGLVAALQEIG